LNIQDIALYNIIKHNRTQYIKPELVPYFSDINKKLYEVVFELYLRRIEINEDTIKNCINIQNWKDTIKAMAIDKAHTIVNMNIMAGLLNIPQSLEREYFDTQFLKIRDSIMNERHTTEIKKQMILDVANVILKSKKADDVTYYDKIIAQISEQNKTGQQTKTVKRSITLQDEMLKTIFGSVLYPHIYTITARPNDFKTTLALNLVSHLEELKKVGVVISFEDNHEVIALKIFAIKSGMDKRELIQQKYSSQRFDEYLPTQKKHIIILDKLRTSIELKTDLDNLCNSQDIDYIMIDYLQRIKPEGSQGIYERMQGVTDMLLEINKQHDIPIIQLSQTDKTNMQAGILLGMGSEKGSGEIAQNTRYGISINPAQSSDYPEIEGYERRIINKYKTTLEAKGIVYADFEPQSGRLVSVGKALASYG
jgi:hypothetical protein